jgi:hypothetical protein
MEIPFPPGNPPAQPGPLARFLPPLDEGMVGRSLRWFGTRGERVLDPFGISPRLVVEAAQAGRAVLVAANNPINRFVLQHVIAPFSVPELQAAVARLASAPMDDSRMEPFLLSLYESECVQCSRPVIADYFVWEREADGPALKGYTCQDCNRTGEDPASQADWERAQTHSRRGLQHAYALEQVAPRGDPDRLHAEAALAVYPARALYALTTLTRKLTQLDIEPRMRAAAEALLLSAFDASNALWGVPESRPRPLQLSASPMYREQNVWRAVERAVSEWSLAAPDIQLQVWPVDGLPAAGQVAVFSGTARELLENLEPGGVTALLTVLPRPNQAYWTLSALWAAWLWGREAAAPIKVALRRRRYDWGWHAAALHTSMAAVTPWLRAGASLLAFLPEAEAGFMAAALAGLDRAGMKLKGRALRAGEGQALLLWEAAGATARRGSPDAAESQMAQAAAEALRVRGEPAPYLIVHAAAWTALARDRHLSPHWQADEGSPLSLLNDLFERALGRRGTFVRWGAGAEPESGLYWLADPTWEGEALADRVETLILEALSKGRDRPQIEIEEDVNQALQGLLTPDRRLVQACLRSYAEFDAQRRTWRLRPEDHGTARAVDLREIFHLLQELAARLGFRPQGDAPMRWLDGEGNPAYAFRVRTTAGLGSLLAEEARAPSTLVLPGGRASLVAEMFRRDPRLRPLLERGRVVKFRHIRRLADETTLRADNFAERLALDPPEHRDPQLPLL